MKDNLIMTNIKHAHRRYIDPMLGTISGKGGATIAYEVQKDGSVIYAVARCHTNDNFNKAQGRVKSAGRLCSPRYRTLFNGDIQAFKNWVYTTPINMIGN